MTFKDHVADLFALRTSDRARRLFPELLPYLLQEAFDGAPVEIAYVVTRVRDSTANMQTELGWIIDRAGVVRYPKLFHNLRASRHTELPDFFPSHVVCKWMDNSKRIAEPESDGQGRTDEPCGEQNRLSCPK